MTLESMQTHERVTLHYSPTDYRRQGLIELVSRHVTGKTVLDLRCLRGDLALRLMQKGHQVAGLDGYEGAVATANQSAQTAGFRDELAALWRLRDIKEHAGGRDFDTVLCIDLLNHVDSDRETLAEIGRVLKKCGELILLVPACPWLLGERDRSLGHLRRYRRREILAILREAGFEVVYSRFWNTLAFLPYLFIEKLLRRRISDRVRFGASESSSRLIGPLMRFWYRHVERLVPFPFGLSIFVVARKL